MPEPRLVNSDDLNTRAKQLTTNTDWAAEVEDDDILLLTKSSTGTIAVVDKAVSGLTVTNINQAQIYLEDINGNDELIFEPGERILFDVVWDGTTAAFNITDRFTPASLNKDQTITGVTTIEQPREKETLLTGSATYTIAYADGTVQTIPMTGDAAITLPAAETGRSFSLVIQNNSGSSALPTFTNVNFMAGDPPEIPNSNQIIVSIITVGFVWYGSYVGPAPA